MDEMMLALVSPGNVSMVLTIALLSRDPITARGADTGPQTTECAARVFYVLGRSELVGCGVRVGPMSGASLNP